MAAELIAGGAVGYAFSKLSDTIIEVIKKTARFKTNLIQIQETITDIKPIFNEIEKLNKVLDRPQEETNKFVAQLEGAEGLVRNCEHIKWNCYKRYRQSRKLEDLNASLLRFFQIDVQLQQARDTKEVLVVVKDMQSRTVVSSPGSWLSGISLLKGVVIGFDDQVGALKAMVLKDSAVDDCSVVVVSAAGGCGKTTLVTMLCHDPVIQGKFRQNIYYATVSSTPNFKVVVNNLLQKNQAVPQLNFSSDEDAISRWGSFVGEKKSDILLVLDDVWSLSVINKFKFKLRGYKILVTSRNTFTQFDTYKLQLLNDQDATNLFWHSAGGSERTDISNDLVDKLVKSCNKHPLALCVIGCSLKGEPVTKWMGVLNKLSEENQSVLDLDEVILLCLAKSLYVFEEESVMKQCYMDLGLFPEDQKIAATTLMDMWVHLYKHDEEGLATINSLHELSSKNLITMSPIRKDLCMIANHCEEKSVMQHDMLRALAIRLSRQEPVEQRKRLIINADGEDLPEWTKQLQHTLNSPLLSISTDERFAFRWNDIQVPKVEVLVLNFMSKIYTLPQFMEKMEELKVLIITNYGFHFSKLENFPAPQHLSGLTRIRLEHVSILLIVTTILELVNLQKLSLIMCEIGNGFEECTLKIPNKLPSLLEIDIDSCHDLFTFPASLCNLVSLKKLSITNCLELSSLSEGFGMLTNLEVLRLTSCSKLTVLPESMISLQKLNVIDISHCLHLGELPVKIGDMGGLHTIHMGGCTGLHTLPQSVKNLHPLKVYCDEEISYKWSDFTHVKPIVVEEDKLGNLLKIIS